MKPTTLRARVVVPMSGTPIENGAIQIASGAIKWCGNFRDRPENDGRLIDLGEVALLPGLINTHCHLDYTNMRGLIAPQPSFAAWIEHINALKRAVSEEEWIRSLDDGVRECRKWGTTTVVNVAAQPRLLPRMRRPPIRIWWMIELIDLREAQNPRHRISEISSLRAQANNWPDAGWGYSPHAPYTASRSLFLACDELASDIGLAVTTHVAESQCEREMFEHSRGPLHGLLDRLGRSMTDCGDGVPFYQLVRAGKLRAPWIVAHANWLEAEVGTLMANCGMTVVHCPRSHAYFQRPLFPMGAWAEAGVRVCVGTDSLASNSSLSLLSELRQLRVTHPDVPAERLVAMVTCDAGAAIGPESRVGALEAGARADAIAVPYAGGPDAVYEAVIDWQNPVEWMMVNGEIVE